MFMFRSIMCMAMGVRVFVRMGFRAAEDRGLMVLVDALFACV